VRGVDERDGFTGQEHHAGCGDVEVALELGVEQCLQYRSRMIGDEWFGGDDELKSAIAGGGVGEPGILDEFGELAWERQPAAFAGGWIGPDRMQLGGVTSNEQVGAIERERTFVDVGETVEIAECEGGGLQADDRGHRGAKAIALIGL
jgi:hypothetical protein